MLRTLLIAITVAGVSLPHVIAGELAGSLPSLAIGVFVGLGCLRLALAAPSTGGRVLGAIGMAAAALAPLVAYTAQEAAEHEPGLAAAHAEPNLLATITLQAPLVILAFFAVRLLVRVARAVVDAWRRGAERPGSPRAASAQTPSDTGVVPVCLALLSSNGQRAPPRIRALDRVASLA